MPCILFVFFFFRGEKPRTKFLTHSISHLFAKKKKNRRTFFDHQKVMASDWPVQWKNLKQTKKVVAKYLGGDCDCQIKKNGTMVEWIKIEIDFRTSNGHIWPVQKISSQRDCITELYWCHFNTLNGHAYRCHWTEQALNN